MNEYRFSRQVEELLESAKQEGLQTEVLLSWISSIAEDISLDDAFTKLVEAYHEWVK